MVSWRRRCRGIGFGFMDDLPIFVQFRIGFGFMARGLGFGFMTQEEQGNRLWFYGVGEIRGIGFGFMAYAKYRNRFWFHGA